MSHESEESDKSLKSLAIRVEAGSPTLTLNANSEKSMLAMPLATRMMITKYLKERWSRSRFISGKGRMHDFECFSNPMSFVLISFDECIFRLPSAMAVTHFLCWKLKCYCYPILYDVPSNPAPHVPHSLSLSVCKKLQHKQSLNLWTVDFEFEFMKLKQRNIVDFST